MRLIKYIWFLSLVTLLFSLIWLYIYFEKPLLVSSMWVYESLDRESFFYYSIFVFSLTNLLLYTIGVLFPASVKTFGLVPSKNFWLSSKENYQLLTKRSNAYFQVLSSIINLFFTFSVLSLIGDFTNFKFNFFNNNTLTFFCILVVGWIIIFISFFKKPTTSS